MAAVGYIRRSASGEAQASEQTQRDTVHRLAEIRGDTIAHVYRDWGRSGGSETRPEYLAMLAETEAGNVHAIYAYDQDRLARSNFLFASLLRLADLRGFAVVTPAGDLTDDDRRDFVEMRGVMDGGELRKITKRNHAIRAKRRDRGDDPGTVPLGYRRVRAVGGELNRKGEPVKPKATIDVLDDPGAIERVLDAYRTAGSYLGAARALTAAGDPVPFGQRTRMDGEPYGNGRFASAIWRATTVRRIVMREAPDLAPSIPGVSRKHRPRLFMKLLVCHCGQTMTPGGDVTVGGYWCTRGQRDPKHSRPYYISENRLMPWIKLEAGRFDRMRILEMDAEAYDDSADRARLEAARDLIGEDAYRDAIGRLNAAREAHGGRRATLHELPDSIDWEHDDVAAINAVLRAYWRHVELGPDLLPVKALWRFDPEGEA